MSRLVLDRVVVRPGRRSIGPIRASFGVGVHGITTASLDDLALLDRALADGTHLEGALRVEGDAPRLLALRDLLPLPGGHTARSLARLLVGERASATLAKAGVEPGALTDRLAAHEAFAFALALAEALPEVGAVLVPPPHQLVPPHDDRMCARRLRVLAAEGFPVLVLLAPGLEPARWVDDLVTIDRAGRASEPRGVATLTRPSTGVIVRGEGLERVAALMVQRGFELVLDPRGRQLTVRSPFGPELERALTDAIAAHDGAVDEVVPCP